MSRVLLPRPAGRDDDATLLAERGFEVVSDPYIEVMDLNDEAAKSAIVAAVAEGAALVLTSSRGLSSIESALRSNLDLSVVRAFAVGPTTAAACFDAGIQDVLSPSQQFDTKGLLELLRAHRPSAVAIPRSGASTDRFLVHVAELGIVVTAAVTYDTRTVTTEPRSVSGLRSGGFDAVVVRSGSAARALAQFVPQWPANTQIVASGEATAEVLTSLGMPVAITSQDSTSFSVAEAVAAILG